MKPRYLELQREDNALYVRADRVPLLSEIDVIVFDCDGVLLDVQGSYYEAVAQTMSALVEAFTSVKLPLTMFDDGLNFAYKQTGGLNNDWDLTYALVMKILSLSSDADRINRLAQQSLAFNDIHERLRFIEENRVEADLPLDDIYDELQSFASCLDDYGVESVDKHLPAMYGVKQALGHPGGIGKSIVTTMFEEIFGGAELFRETFGFPARFSEAERGYVENARVVIKDQTLDQLEQIIRGARFGIASSSPANTARHVLGATIGRFTPEAQVWHDDIKEAEETIGRRDLGKPNPYSLIRSSETYQPFRRVLYVGDTVADRLMAERAGPKYLFAGVYGCVSGADKARESFLRAGCDVVAHSVNNLPQVLKALKR